MLTVWTTGLFSSSPGLRSTRLSDPTASPSANFCASSGSTCSVAERSRASLTFAQRVHRDRTEGELLLEGKVRVACLDASSHRPRPLPQSLMTEIAE